MDGQERKLTTKERIDQALGISGGKSIDEMLDSLNVEAEEFHKAFDDMDGRINAELAVIDKKADELQRSEIGGQLAINDMTASLREIEKMIVSGQQVFQHVVNNITSSDLLDPELVHAAASFLESIHLNVAEFISIYKAKTKFVEKIKVMVFQQQQRIELAELKHRHNLELLREKEKGNAVDAQQGEGGYVFNTDDIVKSLAKSDAFRSAEFTAPRDDEFDEDDDDREDDDEDQEDEDGRPAKRRRK